MHAVQRESLWLSCREATSSSWDDGISSATAHRTVIHFPIDGFRDFCACLWFHCIPQYHASHVYDRSQIDSYTSDLMITAPSSFCGIGDGNGQVYIRTGSSWAQSSRTSEGSAMNRKRVAHDRRRQRLDWDRRRGPRLPRKMHTGRVANICTRGNPRCTKGASVDAVDLHARDQATSHRRSRALG